MYFQDNKTCWYEAIEMKRYECYEEVVKDFAVERAGTDQCRRSINVDGVWFYYSGSPVG